MILIFAHNFSIHIFYNLTFSGIARESSSTFLLKDVNEFGYLQES